MRLCVACKEKKELVEFNRAGRLADGSIRYKSRCKLCINDYDNERYANDLEIKVSKKSWHERYCDEVKSKYYHFLSQHPCVDCGETDILFLECDHIADNKISGVGVMLRHHASWDAISHEIAKCEVRCVKCHRRVTAIRGNWNILKYRNT